MKTIIFANGEMNCAPDSAFIDKYFADAGLVICCDGGVRHTFRLGIRPDFVLGDLDSAPRELLSHYSAEGVSFIEYPRDKDYTDLELGVRFALERGAEEIVICAALGGRFDHQLMNVGVLSQAVKSGARACLVDEGCVVHMIDKSITLSLADGECVSLIPFTEVLGTRTYGMKYPLRSETLYPGYGRGLSNIIIKEPAGVEIDGGLLIVLQMTDR